MAGPVPGSACDIVSDPRPTLHLPARDIPIPTSVSAEAQAVLAMPPMEKIEYPALEDVESSRANDHDLGGDEVRASTSEPRSRRRPVETKKAPSSTTFHGGTWSRPSGLRTTTGASTSTSTSGGSVEQKYPAVLPPPSASSTALRVGAPVLDAPTTSRPPRPSLPSCCSTIP